MGTNYQNILSKWTYPNKYIKSFMLIDFIDQRVSSGDSIKGCVEGPKERRRKLERTKDERNSFQFLTYHICIYTVFLKQAITHKSVALTPLTHLCGSILCLLGSIKLISLELEVHPDHSSFT